MRTSIAATCGRRSKAGAFPEWELGLQIFTEEQAERFSFDILDPTKIIPEELVPLRTVGKLVLNRNPDNFFAETEQVAFCTAHIIPGIDFSNDPLLAGRIHSYVDTQITRLGGPNFHEIPINAPVAQVHNNQRDGMHRQAIHRGRVAYEPNSLGGGCPFQAGRSGFVTFPQPLPSTEDKVRGKPEKFADHYTQARLFYRSQSEVEQSHIVRAFRFELTRVQTQAIRERVVSQLVNVDPDLAARVAAGLGFEVPPAAGTRAEQSAAARDRGFAGTVVDGASRRRGDQDAPHRAARRRGRGRRRAAHHLQSARRSRRRAAPGRRATRRGATTQAAKRCTSKSASRPRPRSCSTRSCFPPATKQSMHWASTAWRSNS